MPGLNGMFKKTTYITLSNRRQSIRQNSIAADKELESPNIPEGLWTKCKKCGARSEERRVGKECRSRRSPYH